MLSPRLLAALWASVLPFGCSSFVGTTPSPDVADAAPDLVPDVPSDLAPDAPADLPRDLPPAPVDAPPACGKFLGPCDPVSNAGCSAGLACVIRDARTLACDCAAPGRGLPGSECAAESDCGPGVHCLFRRCVRLCCIEGGDADCAGRFGARSRCAVNTNSPLISACTMRNQCDYAAQTGCPPGLACYPTSDVGDAICMNVGTSPLNGVCEHQADCVMGATCAQVTVMRAGACQAICNPLAPRCPTGQVCRGFAERPGDWGSCSGR